MNQIQTTMLLYTDASIKEVLSLEDRELVEKVANGDFEAFEELFNKYKGTAMRTALIYRCIDKGGVKFGR